VSRIFSCVLRTPSAAQRRTSPSDLSCFSLLILGRSKVLQSHLVGVHLGNLLSDVVPLVLHGRLQNVAVDVSVLESQLQLLVRLLGASLELIQLDNQELDRLRHLSFNGGLCLSSFARLNGSELKEELCSMYTNDRNDICHDRVCCPTQPSARRGIPREYRVPQTRTLCIIHVL